MSEPAPASIRVRDLSKRYDAVEAVRGISFDVAAGEIFGLLGRNGAGKTTTLECLLGLRRADAGAIAIAGIDTLAEPQRAKQLVGAQLQAATLQDKITPREALKLFASFYRAPAAIGELIEQFALAEKADAPFDSLSGGQRQRLFLALAFVNRPQIVVLDEPTAGLDPQARRELHQLIAGVRASGRTVLLSTHDLDEAHQLCDRIGILHEGRLVSVAKPAELIARSRATPRLVVRTARPFAPADLPGVVNARQRAEDWLLQTTDTNQTILALAQQLQADKNDLLDLQILRPTLEDAFLELTGESWSAEGPRP